MSAGVQHLHVVTGSSRGLGAAMASQLAAPGVQLLCMARSPRPEQIEGLRQRGAKVESWSVDLSRPVEIATRLRDWLGRFDASTLTTATLINNAGVLSQVGPLADSDLDDLSNAMRVGVEAPLLLTSAFLSASRPWAAVRKVLNISSGLGRHAMAGSASYCAAKAGMDHFTRSVALEELDRPNRARIVSLAPGVIDTDMQVQLREAKEDGFPSRARFVGLKQSGQLVSAEATARAILGYMARPEFGEEPIADIREV